MIFPCSTSRKLRVAPYGFAATRVDVSSVQSNARERREPVTTHGLTAFRRLRRRLDGHLTRAVPGPGQEFAPSALGPVRGEFFEDIGEILPRSDAFDAAVGDEGVGGGETLCAGIASCEEIGASALSRITNLPLGLAVIDKKEPVLEASAPTLFLILRVGAASTRDRSDARDEFGERVPWKSGRNAHDDATRKCDLDRAVNLRNPRRRDVRRDECGPWLASQAVLRAVLPLPAAQLARGDSS
jgi:hypothetical protein